MVVQPVGVGIGVSSAKRLAGSGTGADDDEARGLEAGKALVEVGEAGGDPGDGVALGVEPLEVVEALAEQRAEVDQWSR